MSNVNVEISPFFLFSVVSCHSPRRDYSSSLQWKPLRDENPSLHLAATHYLFVYSFCLSSAWSRTGTIEVCDQTGYQKPQHSGWRNERAAPRNWKVLKSCRARNLERQYHKIVYEFLDSPLNCAYILSPMSYSVHWMITGETNSNSTSKALKSELILKPCP